MYLHLTALDNTKEGLKTSTSNIIHICALKKELCFVLLAANQPIIPTTNILNVGKQSSTIVIRMLNYCFEVDLLVFFLAETIPMSTSSAASMFNYYN